MNSKQTQSIRRCGIVATVGPATNILQLINAGVTAFRLNFSHGSHAHHREQIQAIRKAEQDTGQFIPIIADLQGPKIRVGTFESETITLAYGQTIVLELSDAPGADGIIRLPHPEILEALQVGDVVKLDDGTIQLTVTAKENNQRVTAHVDIPGVVSAHKGVNVPTRQLPISALTDKDKADLDFVLSEGVEFVALSFVQRAADVAEAKKLVAGRAMILSKIEKPQAIEELDEIVALSDAVMVARGDLGVELPMEQVPVAQRQIVHACRKLGKPVIVATQMLQSMVETPVPTRAEASDVATAVYMGADAVMLSAESAVGKHPPTAVAVMDRIIRAVEADEDYWENTYERRRQPTGEMSSALAVSARDIARQIGATAIFAFTKTGSSARAVARERARCPLYGLTPNLTTARQMALAWGVTPHMTPDLQEVEDMLRWTESCGKQQGWVQLGDYTIALAGVPFGVPGSTNMLKVMTIK